MSSIVDLPPFNLGENMAKAGINLSPIIKQKLENTTDPIEQKALDQELRWYVGGAEVSKSIAKYLDSLSSENNFRIK